MISISTFDQVQGSGFRVQGFNETHNPEL